LLLLASLVPAAAAERIERTIKVGNLQREYILHLPDSLGNQASWPVIVAFHPGFSSGRQFERATQMHTVNGAQRFIIVYPDGIGRSWNVEECCGPAMKRNVNDLAFFRAIMTDLANFAPVRQRAYITGFSNGAKMTYYTMCNQSDMVAAVAPVGGSITLKNCRTSHPIPLLHIHGELDGYAPLNGGISQREVAGYQPSIFENVQYFVERNSCSRTSESTLVADVRCDNWTGCSQGANVSLCIVPDLGHVWPGGRKNLFGVVMDLGPARPDIPAAQAIVNFFLNSM